MHNQAARGGWVGAALLGAVLGPALQLQQVQLWPATGYGLGMGLAALAAVAGWGVRRRRPAAVAMLALLAATAASFAATGLRAAAYSAQALPAALEGRDIRVTGLVAAMPQRNELGLRFRFAVESAAESLPPQLLLGWYGSDTPGQVPALQPGERWQLTVRLKAPHGNLNPHGFDYELWLWEQGLQATGYVRSGPRDPPAQRVAVTWRHPVERARNAVRDAIYERVPDRRLAGVLAALLVGDQAAIDRADWDVFRATGVAHLMSISGLHVTMFAWVAGVAVGWAWRRSSRLCLRWPAPHAALVGGLMLAAAYALFSGWGVPAQRTVWMLATVTLLRLGGRQWPWPWVWLLACAVVVTVDPWALTQAGFWLSFVAVGVLFATDPGARGGSRALGLLREQGVVTVALTPLSLLLFGQVSLVGLVANLLAIPWVTLVVTPLAMAGILLPPLWIAGGWAVQGLSAVLGVLAAVPHATLAVAAAPLWAGIAGVVGGLLLAMRLPAPLRLLGVPLLLPVLLWQPTRPVPGEFDLLAADIGQGNAVLVRTAGHALVYDTGPRYSAESDAGHRVLVPLLRALDERVDTVALSHRDSDHTGGALAVLQMQAQAGLLSSIEDTHELQALRRATRCQAGQAWEWDGVRFEVLHPAPEDYEVSVRPNGMSCVLRIANARQAVLLAGDIERAQEARLVASGAPLRADVLLVPHHGSKTSSSAEFLDAVQPTLAIVQAGYRNRFGHPAAPVLARYAERSIRVADSPSCGALHWRSDQPRQVRCEREHAARYWHHRFPPGAS